jgi:hypothetical protein
MAIYRRKASGKPTSTQPYDRAMKKAAMTLTVVEADWLDFKDAIIIKTTIMNTASVV